MLCKNIEENILNTDKPDIIHQKIELFVKKRIGIDKNWLERSKIEDWEKRLKELVGDHIAFDIKDTEGKERHRVGGVVEGDYKQIRTAYIYNYQFDLIVMIERKLKEKAHVGVKPKA